MRPIATDGLAWSVCPSRSWALHKRLNRSRCRLGGWLRNGPKELHVLDGGSDPSIGRSNFWELSSSLKSIVSHCCGVRIKKSITASTRLLQPTALLLTGWCHSNSPSWKIPPAMQPVVEILWPLVIFSFFSRIFCYSSVHSGLRWSRLASCHVVLRRMLTFY